jgi:hypothetical protein
MNGHQAENAELAVQFIRRRFAGSTSEPTSSTVRGAAKRVRLAKGLTVRSGPV